jgi:hypothetical protein
MTEAPAQQVSADDERASWRNPAHLLDGLECEVRRVFSDNEDHESAEWHAEVMLCIIIPELREVLREAGLDIPAYGPFSAHRKEHAAAERAAELAAEEARETALYRWWDEADLLLYVGIAGN